MTSGQFTSFAVASIWVDRSARQRKALLKIEDLAKSIADNGLIHPPVIKRDGELIVGERRWTAIKLLGWTHMPVQFVDELSEIELHAIELEENVSRVDLPWQEQCLAVEQYHNLRLAQDPKWTSVRTSEALNMTQQEVSQRRQVAEEIIAGNSTVINAPLYSTARGIVTRSLERKKATAINTAIATSIAPDAPVVVEKIPPLLHGDFLEWTKSFSGVPFNFIHCDFPYGVAMHKSDQGGGSAFGTYEDSPETYWQLLRGLKLAMDNVVSESAHLMFWFSMDFYTETKQSLTEMGWRVNPFPLIWTKSDNVGILPDASRGPRRIYETAFFASRGDRLIVNAVSNVKSAPGGGKSIHSNEKPVEMLQHFMRMFVDEYSLVLDPTCGSGNSIKAAENLGANTLLGIEKDETFFKLAKEAYYADIPEL
jgi:ParB/RepB/Spo0J family partition protein